MTLNTKYRSKLLKLKNKFIHYLLTKKPTKYKKNSDSNNNICG